MGSNSQTQCAEIIHSYFLEAAVKQNTLQVTVNVCGERVVTIILPQDITFYLSVESISLTRCWGATLITSQSRAIVSLGSVKIAPLQLPGLSLKFSHT